MLTINHETLPPSCLCYMAFRIALRETLERMTLSLQIEDYGNQQVGYLTEVPFFRSVPPHIQLDLLADTWSRHAASEMHLASLVDESVVYAVCESSSRMINSEPNEVRRYLHNGPLAVGVHVNHQLASEIRRLHLKLPNNGDFLMISQFEDLAPEEARKYKTNFGLDELRVEAMFEVLGRWHLQPNLQQRLRGLISPEEAPILQPLLKMQTN